MNNEYCDYCHKPLNEYESHGIVDNLGRRGIFCSPDCREKWWKKISEQDQKKFIQWFKEQNIKQIILNPDGNIKIEYQGNNQKELSQNQVVNSQHKQQLKTAKRYLQQTNKNSLDQQELSNLVDKPLSRENKEKPQDYKVLWILGGLGLLITGGLIGWLLVRKRKN